MIRITYDYPSISLFIYSKSQMIANTICCGHCGQFMATRKFISISIFKMDTNAILY